MRRAAIFLPLLLIAGCKEEPDFDTRFDAASDEIEARARAIDADVAKADVAKADAAKADAAKADGAAGGEALHNGARAPDAPSVTDK